MTDLRTGSNLFFPCGLLIVTLFLSITASAQLTREKISINKGWHFFKGDPADAKGIFYSVRPKVFNRNDNRVSFELSGPGEIVATDNGDPGDFTSLSSKERNAFNGLALVILHANDKLPGVIKLTAKSNGLQSEQIIIRAQ